MKRAAHKRRAAASLESGVPEDAPLEYRPEDRMGINVLIAGILYPCAILYYGWMVNAGLYWLAPMVGTTFFGFGSMLVFGSATTMLTEFVPGRSSSAVAVNNCEFYFLCRWWYVLVLVLIDDVHSCSEHFCVYWRCGCGATYCGHWEWVVVHHSVAGGAVLAEYCVDHAKGKSPISVTHPLQKINQPRSYSLVPSGGPRYTSTTSTNCQ